MSQSGFHIRAGEVLEAEQCPSPNADDRPVAGDISLLVVHGISLPPGEFGGAHVQQLFTNSLPTGQHPYFAEIAHLRVSSHLFVNRSGGVIQFVNLERRAWHAGESSWCDRSRCNDYSIGIELEGTDYLAYTDSQYQVLAELTQAIQAEYPAITADRIVGHQDIAPGRKTDPGLCFDWHRYLSALQTPAA